MQSISLRSRVGSDGILQLEIPIGLTNTDLEVMVIVHPLADTNSSKAPEDLGWPPGFFERTAGAWQGEPLTRGEQGEYEKRDELLRSTFWTRIPASDILRAGVHSLLINCHRSHLKT